VFELDEQRRNELVETWARRVVARGLGTAAVFLLEAHKPLGRFGASALVAFEPLIRGILSRNPIELAAFVADVDNIERLILRIEALEDERVAQQTAELRRRREVRRRARSIARLRRRRGPPSVSGP